MLLYSVPSSRNGGFTLIESAVITIIIGVLAAIAVPSFREVLRRMEVNQAMTLMQGTIQDVQNQSIKRSKTCSVAIDTVNKKMTAGIGNCNVFSNELPRSVTILNNGGNPTFDYRGQTTTLQTIVIANASQSNKKCLVISNGIGMIRTGNYTGNLDSPINSSNCITS